MKKLTVSFLVLIVLNALAIESKACHKEGKDGHKDKFFSYIDANKDGKLTQGEMLDNATKMFKEHDKNKDGVITMVDVKDDVSANFTESDKNKDGFVDKDELKAHFKTKHKEYYKSK